MSSTPGDDSSYDADETPAQAPAGQAAPAEPQACSAQGCCCCSRCPFAKLSPENLEATLQRNASFIEEFQGAIFFRRPIAFAALILSVNLVFFLYHKLNLSFYAQVCLIGILYMAFQIIPTAIISQVKSLLFPGKLEKGQPNQPNRIRDTNELVAPINTVLSPLFGFVKIVRALSQDQSVSGQLIYASVFLCIFCFTAVVDLFWPIVIFTNLALILPGVLTLPQVVPYIQKAKEQIKPSQAAVETPAAPADVQSLVDSAKDKLAEGLQQAQDVAADAANSVQNDAQDVADKLHEE